MSAANRLFWCDFFGKTNGFVKVMVGAPSGTIHICDECIAISSEVVAAEGAKDAPKIHVAPAPEDD